MKRGLNVSTWPGIDLPEPAELPVDFARFQAIDPEPYPWTATYAAMLKDAGKDGLARFNWRSKGVRAFAEKVDVDWHEYGNEPPAEHWVDLYRPRLLKASPIYRAAGRKVVLAASRTEAARGWLSSTPDAVYEAVDAVALHPYQQTPRAVLEAVQEARPLVPDHLPLIVSEIGISTNSRGVRGAFPVIDPTGKTVPEIWQEQAHWLRHTFRLLDEHAAELKLILTVCFCHRVAPPTVLKRWGDCGVTNLDGTNRPAFEALAP